MYLIDTDVLSDLRKPRPDRNVVDWVSRQNPTSLFLSVITVMEIARGAEKQRDGNPAHASTLDAWLADNLTKYGERVLPITSDIALRWGRLQILLQRGDDDLAIAATALAHGFSVVTRNVRHFDKTGVTMVNPFASAPDGS